MSKPPVQPALLWAAWLHANDGLAVWAAKEQRVLQSNPAWEPLLTDAGLSSSDLASNLLAPESAEAITWSEIPTASRKKVQIGSLLSPVSPNEWLLLLPENTTSQVDIVTGVADRRRLQQELETRFAGDRAFAVVFVDLDGFKQVNDHLGHMAGDVALRRIAQRLAHHTRPQDLVARFGGDEFVILVDDAKQASDLAPIIQRVQNAISQPQDDLPPDCPLSASIGLAFSGDNYLCPADMLTAADQQMYARKRERGSDDHSAA